MDRFLNPNGRRKTKDNQNPSRELNYTEMACHSPDADTSTAPVIRQRHYNIIWTCMRFVDVKSKTCGCHEIGWRSMADRRSVGRVPRGARHQARTTRHKLVFGRSCWTLNHDAVIRIGGEAPGRRAHSKPRLKGHVQSRVATTSDRHLQFVMI